jgi:hypothetical protein
MSAGNWLIFGLAVILCGIVVWTWREWERQEIERQFRERQRELDASNPWDVPADTGIIRFTHNGPRFITKPPPRKESQL